LLEGGRADFVGAQQSTVAVTHGNETHCRCSFVQLPFNEASRFCREFFGNNGVANDLRHEVERAEADLRKRLRK
jgi:hypothetical protein